MYANTTSIFVFGHGVGYTVEKAVEAATTHSDENGARKRKPFASGHKGAKETHMEVGSSGNTMTEALKGIRLFGEVLSDELLN